MRRSIGIALFLLAGAFFFPAVSRAAGPADEHAGKVLLDVSGKGEAWYVNPQTRARVYLGRPAEALERLKDRTIWVSYGNIARLPETEGAPTDEAYEAAVSGFVLSPNDLVGASWYVDPASGLRRRLATPNDAWDVMRAGTPVSAAVLKAIPVEGETPAEKEKSTVARIKDVPTATTLELEDGSTVRLVNVEVPSNPELQEAAKAKIRELAKGGTVLLERDADGRDRSGNKVRYVHAGSANINYELVRNGLAFHAIEQPNFKYAELLVVGAIDAARLKRGFWDQTK